MKKGILCLIIIFIVASIPPISEGKESAVCMTYFYVEGCEGCEAFKPFLESMEKNFSFLNVERYELEKNLELFEDIKRAYDAYFGTPIVFIGNEWYYFDPEQEDFQEKINELEKSIREFEKMGGVECPVVDGELANFPKPVCVLEFYNFTEENEASFMQQVEDALKENVSYTQVKAFDVSTEINSTILKNLCNTTHQEFFSPRIFVGEKAFPVEETYFNNIIGGAKNFSKTGMPCPEIIYGGKEICIIFFLIPTCHECMEAKDKLEYLKFKYPLNITEINKFSDKGLELLPKYYKTLNVSQEVKDSSSFIIFTNDSYYYELSQFNDLEEEIKKHVDIGLECPEPSEEGSAEEEFEKYTLLAVLALGLGDGINPCAFAVLVFFIAYLERMRHSKKALLSIGIAFSLAVFIGYLLIGISLLAFFYSIEGIGVVSEYVYLFAGIFALLLAALNIVDYFRIGKEEKTVLQLPRFLKKRRGRVIKILTEKRSIMLLSFLAFVVGFAIALIEFPCTGQFYIVAAAVIKSASSLKTTAFAYLILYNIMFIIPLLLIFSFFYLGYASEVFGEMQKRRQRVVKIFTAAILLLVGIYMLFVAL